MSNEDGTVWTVFNGEIYNHRQLRAALEDRGHSFRGSSDTEVLTHLYEEKGPAFVEELRGMFAIALYDTRTHTLILVRDRFGIKPLFYAPGHDRLGFASEIRTLLHIPGIDTQPNRQAIFDFAALFFVPSPATFYTGIRALPPGRMLEARLDDHRVSWKTRTYHQWEAGCDSTLSLEHATRRADALLESAVQRQLESDVPLGSLLSGGIDSSLVSCAAQTALNGKLRTFSVRFSEAEYDETSSALAVAETIRSHHQVLEMGHAKGGWDEIQQLLVQAGQPFADTSLFALNAICRLMRRRVRVVLSGDGGDEAFGGYNIYWWLKSIAQWQSLPNLAKAGTLVGLGIMSLLRIGHPRLLQHSRELRDCDDTAIVQYLFCRMRQREHAKLCRDGNLLPVRRLFERQWGSRLSKGASRLERLTLHATEANVRLRLADGYLFKVDMASMRESLEVRVPFLDEDLFAFGLTLPNDLKTRGRTAKRVLRSLARSKLPARVANKPKQGFAIPFDVWSSDGFKVAVKDALLDPSSRLPEFFHPEAYRPLVRAFCAGRLFSGLSREALWQRVVMLLSVHLTLENSKRG